MSKQNKDKDETKQEKNQQRMREGYRWPTEAGPGIKPEH